MTSKECKDFDVFVKKYNDAVELHNSKCRTIPDDDKLKPLIDGTYSFNEDGTIDIGGDFTMQEIFAKDHVFVIDDFPFKINRVSGDFEIFSTSLKNLDMFPRLVEGEVSICGNFDLRSVEGVAGSTVKGDCLIDIEKAETIYFPDFVGGSLTIGRSGPVTVKGCNLDFKERAWKDFCKDKTVQVGGYFCFDDMHCTDPRVPELKEIVKAKEYQFGDWDDESGNREKCFFTIAVNDDERWLKCRILAHEDPIGGKPFFRAEPAYGWDDGKWDVCISLKGEFLKAVKRGERGSIMYAGLADVEKLVKKWLQMPYYNYPKMTNFIHIQMVWNLLNPNNEIEIKEWCSGNF